MLPAALSAWFLLFAASGARGECPHLPFILRTESVLYYPCKNMHRPAFMGLENISVTAASARVSAVLPLLPLYKAAPEIDDPFLSEKPSGVSSGSLNYFITHPGNGNSRHPEENRLFEDLMQLIFLNGKNVFSSNNILLFKDARFFRSYYSIYIYIYTNFDDIERIESLKNIETVVPRINLTIRTGIQ